MEVVDISSVDLLVMEAGKQIYFVQLSILRRTAVQNSSDLGTS